MKLDLELLKKFENNIDTIHPENGKIPIKILGYGEISLVFEILNDPNKLAYKRIPIFDNESQVKRHVWAYNEYNRILEEDVGLNMPEYDIAWFKDDLGKIKFYCVQQKIHPDSVGNKVIHNISIEEIKQLFLKVMREMKKVWKFSKYNPIIDVGLDGQISNFAIKDYDPENLKIDENTELYYLDTSTPMFKINGKEAMEAVLFLKSAPSFLRWLLKALFLEDTVNRYYDWRRVTIDLIANFFKEQKPELILPLINLANQFFRKEAADFDIEPIELKEIQDYYKSDRDMWIIFQSVRKFDRFLKTKIFKKEYEFYLPGEIER
ncbi:MAG: hypothetical protein GF317_00795 [Candidatus Lokiarchaeota archaeon]|nr:hypothetical protein [Candidatus Lokiarchaeota archaeon]MBD3198498.1 hypothetical protein [Candidatus Lokiarchaeota archaeon]